MATVYFTNNADSGDGSLRAAISAAASGDVVTYSDSAFADTDEIVIPLSSRLAIIKDVVLDARGKRIVLDGQFTSRCLWVSADLQLRKVDLINGYSDSSFSGGLYISQGAGAVTLDACRIHGCFSKFYGSALYAVSGSVVLNDCLITGCCTETAQVMSASVRAHSDSSVAINRCTIVGDAQRALSAGTDGLIVVADSLVQGVYNVSSAVSVTPSTCGFATPCPDVIDSSTWDNTLWQSWDFRLTPESPYLTGAETSEGEVDVLGHTRKANGAIGAYEGAWKVVDSSEETWTLTQNETVEYLDVRDRGRIKLAGYFLNVQEKAYLFSNDSFDVTDGKYGYIGCNEVVEYGDFPEEIPEKVIIVQRGADVASVSVSNVVNRTANIEITKNGTGDYVVLAGQIGPENWARITIADGSFVIPTDRAFKVRVFDGDKLLDTQPNPRKYYFTGTTTGSFAEKTDWALDPEKTLVCNESPIVAGCTFICE